MSDLDNFFNNAHDEVDAVLGTETMVVDGQTFSVVWNQYSVNGEGADGGIQDIVAGAAVAQPADVTTPEGLDGLRCTISTRAYRIDGVAIGDVAITFTLVDPDATS